MSGWVHLIDLFARAIYYISVAGHCSKLRRHLLCHENASTGFMVEFRLLVVGRYSVYAVGKLDVQHDARNVRS